MSDNPEGPGWWVASDGKWYPPELHPSVRDDSRAQVAAQVAAQAPAKAPVKVAAGSEPHRWQGQADRSTQVGPQFPDLFKKALEGSHLADNISVKYGNDDERNVTAPAAAGSMAGARSGGSASSSSGASSTAGSTAKRKWRKGR
jgi:hypothetical protein